MYDYLKAFHIIIDFAWIAGLLIYPRYKLHQMSAEEGTQLFSTMQSAALKLRKIILTPSLILAWVSGLSLLWLNEGVLSQGWLHAKLLLLLILSGLHGYLIGLGRKIDQGQFTNRRAVKLLNEAPFVLMAIIVILAVVKPF